MTALKDELKHRLTHPPEAPTPRPDVSAMTPRERLAALSGHEIEGRLRKILDDNEVLQSYVDALEQAADLCAAVREFLADSAAGERKGLAKTDGTVVLIGQEKTEHGPMVAVTCSAFGSEPGGKIMLTRREALVIDGGDGTARISVRRISW